MTPKELTTIERQILSNQFQILAKLNEDNEYESKRFLVKSEIVTNGYTGEYHEIFDVHSDEISFETCEETSKILNMYRRINNIISGLSVEEKNALDLQKIEFEGFDGNNDDHYHYTNFMVENLDKWQELKDVNLNSHTSFSIQKYRSMLSKHDELLKNKSNLDKDDLTEIINAV